MAGIHWPGLMAWSTQYHDGTAPSNFKQMSEEDKEFLEKAMKHAMSLIEDPNLIFKEAIDKVKVPGATDIELITCLEVIDRCCDDPDVSRNVEKLDGLQAMLDLVALHDGTVRARSLEILALLLSNNPSIQDHAVKRGAMKVFLNQFEAGLLGSEERSKAFRALVSLVRNVEAYEIAFLRDNGGVEVLLSCLNLEEGSRVREKAVNFVRGVACEGRLGADDISRFSVAIVPLVRAVGVEEMQYRETLASCAIELLRSELAAACPPELADGLRLRAGQVKTGEDEKAERSLLEECLTLLK